MIKHSTLFWSAVILGSFLMCASPNEAQAALPEPVGLFVFDEGSGTTVANYAGSGIPGTVSGSPSWVTGLLGSGYALRLRDTLDDKVKVTDAGYSNLGKVTLSAWVYPIDNTGIMANSLIISKGDNAAASSRFALAVGSDASSVTFNAGFSGTSGSWKTPAGSIIPIRVWHHIVVTYDFGSTGNDPKIYIDGMLQNLSELAAPAGSPAGDDANLYFGSIGNSMTRDFGGFLDQVRIYNEALSSTDVQTLVATDAPITVKATGSEEMIFDWSSQRCEVGDTPDAPARAWREANGQVSLIATHDANYRMKGPTLNSVARDCNMIMASGEDPDLADANYYEWLVAPYTLDGHTIYSLVHAEWYPRLAGDGCANWWDDGTVTALTLAKSTDGGSSFIQPDDYKVWQSPVAWDPSFACTADYGGWNPSNIVKKGNYYYSLFLVVNDPSGYITQGGPYLMRTADLSSATAWEIYTGTGSGWDSSLGAIGAKIDTMGVPESLTYNSYLGAYLMVANLWDAAGQPKGVYYTLSQDLITWTKPVPMLTGAKYAFYPSLLDPSDTSMNFEYSGQDPYVYYTTAPVTDPVLGVWDRDLVRQRVHFTKNDAVQPPPPGNRLPIGNFDEIRLSDGVIRGWTLDPDAMSTSIPAHVFIGGPAGSGTLLSGAITNILRTDVNNLHGASGNHGFEVSIPAQYRNGVAHSVYVYGVDSSNAAASTLLPGSPRSFTLAAADVTRPTVSVTAPANGSTVSGTAVSFTANASDNVGVAGVQFKVDGSNAGSEDTTAPYSVTWNSTTVANGSHSVIAVARDAAGNIATSATVSVAVNNSVIQPPPPTPRSPIGRFDEVTPAGVFRGWALDLDDKAAAIAVHYYTDGPVGQGGTLLGGAPTSMLRTDVNNLHGATGNHGFEVTIPARLRDGRTHTLYLYGIDSANTAPPTLLAGSPKSFNLTAADTILPAVAITAPADRATVSGSAVTVSANASDNVGVSGVQFRLNGVNLGAEDTSAPYSVTWNTSSASNSLHSLSAVARDAAGNRNTSTITARVSNIAVVPTPVPVPAPTPPPVPIPRDGRLIRQSGQATVYVMEYGRKRAITNINTFIGFGYSWISVKTMPDVSYIPSGDNLSTASQRHVRGSVVVGRGLDKTVYFLGAAQRYPFTSWEIYRAWGLVTSDLLPANSYDLALPVGPALSSPAPGQVLGDSTDTKPVHTLVKAAGPQVYVVTGYRRLYPFATGSELTGYGYRFQDIIMVLDTELLGYEIER